MYEDIIPTLKTNEPKSLSIVKPFDRAFCLHKTLLSSMATLSYAAAPEIKPATHMIEEKDRMQNRLERSVHWRDKINHKTHLCCSSRSMYHGISNIVKPFFDAQAPA